MAAWEVAVSPRANRQLQPRALPPPHGHSAAGTRHSGSGRLRASAAGVPSAALAPQ